MYRKQKTGKECMECGQEMSGIMSYRAREVCEPCGGQALMGEILDGGQCDELVAFCK